MDSQLRVAFLIGSDDSATVRSIARVCAIEGVRPAVVLLDTGQPGGLGRLRNLRRNIRREGYGYVWHRAVTMLKDRLDSWADRVIDHAEVDLLLDQAFPERSLQRIGERYGFPVVEVANLNSEQAQQQLQSAEADLGLVLGTRVLKRGLFSIPRLGCINVHKGKVPEYRGMPPGFWELYDGRSQAQVTIHFVDDGLDTGDVVGTTDIAIHALETPESLRAKLTESSIELLETVLRQFIQGTVVRTPQPQSSAPARTRPTRAQQEELARRLPHWRRLSAGRSAVKTILWLAIFHSGLFALVRWKRRAASRGAIVLYHRVNDLSQDVLTTSTRRFAEHLVAMRRYYSVVRTEELVNHVAGGTHIPATSVAVHFDDCYRDVHTCAAPILAVARVPATSFVSSGFIDTAREFQHDRQKYPHRFANLSTQEVRELPGFGVEVAAHTVNHVDLGTVSLDQAELEVVESRRALETIVGHPVLLFSFPFGGIRNIREEVRGIVVASGYKALFSAHGGFIGPRTELFDIPRFGVSSEHSALALLMELEGFTPGNWKRLFR